MKNPIPFLRKTALVEAVSFLVLLGIAMPLKYLAGMPMAVKVVGWVHGVLFVTFCFALLQTLLVAKWPFSRAVMIFIAALLPFGPFVVDRRMTAWEEEFRLRQASAPVP
jgi:integral membrane protein